MYHYPYAIIIILSSVQNYFLLNKDQLVNQLIQVHFSLQVNKSLQEVVD